MSFPKPLPVADPDSRPFWEGCRRRELLLQRCADCGRFRFPPSSACPGCGSRQQTWVEASGKGRVYSWVVVVRPVPREVFADDVPYVVALVELDEGVRLPTNLVGCDPDAVVGDMAVEVVFEEVTPEVTLPKFRPAHDGKGARQT